MSLESAVLSATGQLVDNIGKLLLRKFQSLPGLDTLRFKKTLLDELRPAGLGGEIGLGEGDFLLPRITVLGD